MTIFHQVRDCLTFFNDDCTALLRTNAKKLQQTQKKLLEKVTWLTIRDKSAVPLSSFDRYVKCAAKI